MKNLNQSARAFIFFALAAILAGMFAHTKVVSVAIGVAFAVSFVVSVLTKGTKKYWFSDTISALLGSQFGWCALLI